MILRCLFPFAALLFAFAASAAEPFIAIRQAMPAVLHGDFIGKTIEIHARHPGSCDEIWFDAPDVVCTEKFARETLGRLLRWRAACEKAGIRFSVQQGNTLGHGQCLRGTAEAKPSFSTYAPGDLQTFTDDAWMVDAHGNRLTWRRFCPSSPETIDAAYRYAKLVLQTLRPYSYWPDDDLRLGFCTQRGCFCERCRGRSPEELLAGYLKAYRRAADEVCPAVRFGLQTVAPSRPETVSDYRKMLASLSDGKTPVSIRPGDLFFSEKDPRDVVRKTLGTAAEAERCSSYGDLVGRICHEEDNYPRTALQKSPAAIVIECALALASGANSLSMYYAAGGEEQDDLDDYERFARCVAESRPYLERVAASTERTHLGGVVAAVNVALSGVPVAVAESPAALLWPQSIQVSDAKNPLSGCLRKRILEELDRQTAGKFPVRVDFNHALRILPRIDRHGRVDSVTVFNCSMGETFPFAMRVRNPAGPQAVVEFPRKPPSDVPASVASGETVVQMPSVGGYQIVTVFFE